MPPGPTAHPDAPASPGPVAVAEFLEVAVLLPPHRILPDASGRTKSMLQGELPVLQRSVPGPTRPADAQLCGHCAARTETP
ncbi:Uncharacterised protein [Mycobacteroides abscessus subsp. abscessus]|nr:Uncharacterised protein [Mycobacteroides abscessus subsp. abscessus]